MSPEAMRTRASPLTAKRALELGANDRTHAVTILIVSGVIRRNELQAWFVAEHLVNVPLTHASSGRGSER